jgi:hypothetical protein
MEKQLVKEIILEQKEEIKKIFKEKIVEREVEKKAKKMLETNLIKVIIGPRRCGKSVLAHRLLKGKKYGYINFDDERLIGIRTNDLNDCLEVLEEINPNFKYLLLDEIQNIKGWELFVNRLKRGGYNIVITGSNSKLLSKELATHLTGRHFVIELSPFSFREFLSYKGFQVKNEDFFITQKRARIKKFFDEYLKFGGFPEVLKFELKKQYLRELYDKIITRDILSRYSIKYIKDLKEIAFFAVSNFGSKISYHKIKNIFEIKSVHTAKNYLNYLEEAYLIFQLLPFSFKIKNQIRQPKKLYAIDTGLINAIRPKFSFDIGRLMENLVFLELKRQSKEIYFYSQANNYEVDFAIREGLKIKQLIQVCYSLAREETKKREIKSLLRASKDLKCKNLLIITSDYEGEEKFKNKKIKYIPLWKWLLQSV